MGAVTEHKEQQQEGCKLHHTCMQGLYSSCSGSGEQRGDASGAVIPAVWTRLNHELTREEALLGWPQLSSSSLFHPSDGV